MKQFISYLFFAGMAIRSVVGQLPGQLAVDLNNYFTETRELRSNFVNLPVDLDTKSQVSAITNGLARLGSSINALNATAADIASHSPVLAPAEAAQLIDEIQLIAGNTTEMVSALVTKTYFCLSFGIYIDSTMVPAKETIYWALDSLNKITPDPLKVQLLSLRTSLTNSYYKALVYRNYYHDFDRPCIPWGTWGTA